MRRGDPWQGALQGSTGPAGETLPEPALQPLGQEKLRTRLRAAPAVELGQGGRSCDLVTSPRPECSRATNEGEDQLRDSTKTHSTLLGKPLLSQDIHPQERMNSKRKKLVLTSFVLSLMLLGHYFRNRQTGELQLSEWFNPRKRPDVITITDWLAPIIWEGTYNRQVLEKYHQRQNVTVGLAVCAVGRFAEEYVDAFIHSANKHFMTGHNVIFYIMADTSINLPEVKPDPLRTFKIYTISPERWWYDPNLVRMKTLGEHIILHIQNEVEFLFSMTMSQIFHSDFGVETLGESVAQLHAWWYFKNTKNYPYERRPQSAACIPFGQGDFYYDGSILGGTPQEVLKLIEEYIKGVIHDNKNKLNSTFESHLNKYFFLNKPTKLLSPEYNWDLMLRLPPQIKFVKIAQHSERSL
ncbi:putative glycosyltransferase 6 domain-containing protein 1 [Tamandua tetradactyla]|uniref:putative glycosyltransferase 6 domain-containing protein 1 n=1 Tax=Tamandua tetradactyla TaxID=48850 RepID=UPI00405489A5